MGLLMSEPERHVGRRPHRLPDRLIHHADVIALEGDSYHLREAEQARTKKRPAKQPPKA
jgi:hypothetical protein